VTASIYIAISTTLTDVTGNRGVALLGQELSQPSDSRSELKNLILRKPLRISLGC